MKIIFAGGYKTPDFGGVNSYMLCLSKQLKSMGHECVVIRQAVDSDTEVIEGVKFINLAVKGPRSLGFFLYNLIFTFYILRKEKWADVICFQSCYMNNILSLILGLKGYKVACIMHSFACDNPQNNVVVGKTLLLIEKLSTIGYNNIITVGESMAGLVKDRLNKNAWIVRGGIFLPNLKDELSSTILTRLGLEEDGYYLTMARIIPVKKLEFLIRGFKQYSGKRKLIIGGNVDNDYGRMLVDLASGDERIVFAGSVFGADKEQLLRHCFAYCLVSSSEGFPISLLEAMSYGKRSIVSKIGPNVEMLGEENGVWCKVDSSEDITAALLYMDKQIHREEIEERVKSRVINNFTWDKSAQSFIEAIQSFSN